MQSKEIILNMNLENYKIQQIRTKYVILFFEYIVIFVDNFRTTYYVPFGIPLNVDHSAPGLHNVTRVF